MKKTKWIVSNSHRVALKVFERIGFKLEVRRFGESRLGLLRWPLREVAPGKMVRRLVVVPGFGDTPLSWLGLLAGLRPILKRKVDEVVLVDYPGYNGFLQDDPAFESMEELLRCFRDVMRTLHPTILLGHSLGGWLAGDYAIESAGLEGEPQELILVDPGGLVETDEDKHAYRSIFVKAIEKGPREVLPHTFAKTPFWAHLFMEGFFAFLKSPEVRAFIASFEEKHLLNGKVGRIRAKTTVLWGEKDTLTPAHWIGRWLAALPVEAKGTGILIRGSGHSPQVEKPGVLMALLTQIFLGGKPEKLQLQPFWKVYKPAA